MDIDFSNFSPLMKVGGEYDGYIYTSNVIWHQYADFGSIEFNDPCGILNTVDSYAYTSVMILNETKYLDNFTITIKFRPAYNQSCWTSNIAHVIACFCTPREKILNIYTLDPEVTIYLMGYTVAYDLYFEIKLHSNTLGTNVFTVKLPNREYGQWHEYQIGKVDKYLIVRQRNQSIWRTVGVMIIDKSYCLMLTDRAKVDMGFAKKGLWYYYAYYGELAYFKIDNYQLDLSDVLPIKAWWHFNEPAGATSSSDLSGRGNTVEWKTDKHTGGLGYYDLATKIVTGLQDTEAWATGNGPDGYQANLYGKTSFVIENNDLISKDLSINFWASVHSTQYYTTQLLAKNVYIYLTVGNKRFSSIVIKVGSSSHTLSNLVYATSWINIHININKTGTLRVQVFNSTGVSIYDSGIKTYTGTANYNLGGYYGWGGGSGSDRNHLVGVDEFKCIYGFYSPEKLRYATFSPYENNTSSGEASFPSTPGFIAQVTASVTPANLQICYNKTETYQLLFKFSTNMPVGVALVWLNQKAFTDYISASSLSTWEGWEYPVITHLVLNFGSETIPVAFTFNNPKTLPILSEGYTLRFGVYSFNASTGGFPPLFNMSTPIIDLSVKVDVTICEGLHEIIFPPDAENYTDVAVDFQRYVEFNETDIRKYVWVMTKTTYAKASQYEWTVSIDNIASNVQQAQKIAFAESLKEYNTIASSNKWYTFNTNATDAIILKPLNNYQRERLRACGQNVSILVTFSVKSSYSKSGVIQNTFRVLYTYREINYTGQITVIVIPDHISGKTEEVYDVTVKGLSPYKTNFTWSCVYPYGYNDTRNPRLIGLPNILEGGKEYPAKVKMPISATGEISFTLYLYDVLNPNSYGFKTIYVNCTSALNVSFSAWIYPSSVTLPEQGFYILRLGVRGSYDTYSVHIRNPYTFIGFNVENVFTLGTGSEVTKDIHIFRNGAVSKGEYLVEFVFYNSANEYISKTLTVTVTKNMDGGGGGGEGGGWGGNATFTPTAPWTSLEIARPVGFTADLLRMLSTASGIPEVALGFVVSIVIFLIVIILMAKYRINSEIAYAFGILLTAITCTILGFLPGWILLFACVVIAITFGLKVYSKMGGRSD